MFAFNEYLLFGFSYLLGSIPFGVIVVKFAGLGDIYKQGSGNIGATNIVRVAGKKLGVITFLLDFIKGIVPSLIFFNFYNEISENEVLAIIAVLTILGHCFPIWLKFKGGKGVATSFGIVLALSYQVFLIVVLIWFLAFKLSKTSSIGALVAYGLLPFVSFAVNTKQDPSLLICYFLISVIIFVRHIPNIKRLLKNEEKSFK